MPVQIALSWSEESEKEMIRMGFTKKEVYTKSPPSHIEGDTSGGISDKMIRAGDREFRNMKNPPHQWTATSWWAQCID